MDGVDRDRRRRVASAVLAALLGVLGAAAVTRPAAADPNSDKRRVDQQLAQTRALYEGASAAVQAAMQAYTAASAELPAAQNQLADARGVVAARRADADQAHRDALAARTVYQQATDRYAAASARVDAAREVVSSFTASAYKGSGLVAFASIFESGSPTDLADRISYVEQVSRNQRDALTNFMVARGLAGRDLDAAVAARQQADGAEAAAQRALAAARAAEQQAAQAQAQVTALIQQRAAAVAAANAQRSAVLAQYRALQAESDRIAAQLRAQAARDRQSGHGSSATGMQPGAFFLTPVRGAYKSSGFGMRYDPYYHVWQLHAGVDLAAPGGTPIYAAGPGQVVRAGWAGGYGNYTCIYHGLYHGQGLDTCYGHQSRILVHVGQVVGRGQLIGLVGQTGAATGYHLHFEVRLDGVPVQPLNWLPACLC